MCRVPGVLSALRIAAHGCLLLSLSEREHLERPHEVDTITSHLAAMGRDLPKGRTAPTAPAAAWGAATWVCRALGAGWGAGACEPSAWWLQTDLPGVGGASLLHDTMTTSIPLWLPLRVPCALLLG